jgi:molybdopterin converting factor small subunit
MFAIDVILGTLKKLVSFLWEYKFIILTAVIITVLYLRGNNYKDEYKAETVAHNNTVLQYEKELTDIRLANEQALRIAQEESAANYKELVEKTQGIQEKYNEQNETINTTINRINNSSIGLHKAISNFTTSDSNNGTVSNKSDAERLQLTGELLAECVGRKQYFAIEAEKLNNSVKTLQNWGMMVIENNATSNKDEEVLEVEKD